MAWPGFPGSPFILSFHGYLGPVCAPATARNAGNSLQASLPTVNVLRDLETRPHSALLGFGLSSSEAENQAWC